jgi:flagellar biosynthesis protein FlhF
MSSNERLSNLYVKSFFAASIPEAMEQAQGELGPDALLLNSRQSPPEARHLGGYEVVFGVYPGAADAAAPAPAAEAPAPIPEIDDLNQRMDELQQMIARLTSPSASRPDEDPALTRALIDAGIETELARDIDRTVRKRPGKGAVRDIARPRQAADREPQSLLSAAAGELESRFAVQPEIGRVTALVGPPGSGKTTTLVKLAVNQCLKLGHPVRLVSADTLRIGGAEPLRTYATILGVPFQAVENTVALAQAVDSASPNTWVLIDTPGFSAAMQQELGGELAAFLRRRQDIDTHLVLTASMNAGDLRNTADRFAAFGPSKLIFTRTDETTSAGSIFSEAVRTQRPVSFLCYGQSVPEDIHAASKDLVIESLVRQLPTCLQAVA